MLFLAASTLPAQDLSDGCNSALDSLNRLKELFYANAEALDYKRAYSNLTTATRNCPDVGELWYFRSLLGAKAGAPENQTAYAMTKARALGWRRNEGPVAQTGGLPARLGTKWALVVGVGKFEDPKLSELKYPASDAQSLRDLMVDPGVGRFPASNVRLLRDEEAKVQTIREGIGWLREHAKPDDLVVVYFASHGLPRDQDPNGVSYIAANDSSLENAAKRYSTSIQMVDLVQDLTRELQALRLILILDTCYSGDAGSAAGQEAVATLGVSRMTSFSEALRLFQAGAGRVVMTAASADQKSWESEKLKHGYFTHFLLRALQESAGKITVGDLYKRVKSETESAVRENVGKPQTPLMIAGSGAASISIGAEPGQ